MIIQKRNGVFESVSQLYNQVNIFCKWNVFFQFTIELLSAEKGEGNWFLSVEKTFEWKPNENWRDFSRKRSLAWKQSSIYDLFSQIDTCLFLSNLTMSYDNYLETVISNLSTVEYQTNFIVMHSIRLNGGRYETIE